MNTEELREFCLALPHTTEDVKWGNDLCFSIGGKMYCVTGLGDADAGKISFKCTPEKFAELTERNGVEPAAYVARYHWVTVSAPNALAEGELEQLISNSYKMVRGKLPAKVRKGLESK
ncbi:MAG: MmcQ/YjbR family DNA-binding protein [Pyrinomonadaceae bacterium]